MSIKDPITQPGALKERRRRQLIQHIITNKPHVLSGSDDHYRALCGHTFPVRHGKPSWTHPVAERIEWIQCPWCEAMRILQGSM